MAQEWRRKGAFCTAVICAAVCLSAGTSPAQAAAAGVSGESVQIMDPQVPLASYSVRACTAPGTQAASGSGAVIDYSNASEGYVMVKYTGGSSKVRLQITGSNQVTYTYVLHPGVNEAFPLTSGSGSYTINVYENIQGSSYAQALGKTINAQIANPLSPYLYPSQYVNFDANCQTVAKGQELAAGATSDLQVLTNVYNWVISNISYDNQKAATVQSGYLPVVDNVLATRKGICFDYAAVIASMLRSQNIPTRMEVGYVSTGVYHAWISVYTPETGWINNVIQFDGSNWKLMDPTFASSGAGSAEIMSFIGNTSNYKKMYVY